MRAALYLALAALCLSLPARAEENGDEKQNEPTLSALAAERGIHVGAAVDGWIKESPNAQRLLPAQFDAITTENALKFANVNPDRGMYDFRRADDLVEMAAANGQLAHGHVLVWHEELPEWLRTQTYPREELIAILREHIRTLVGRYRGRIAVWDVVNEAFEADGSFRKSIWYDGIGPEYIELAFRFAREADPDAKLLYNDYDIEVPNKKSNAIYRLLSEFRARGVPIDGIGSQSHLKAGQPLDIPAIRSNIKRFGALGLSFHITEFDIRLPGPVNDAKLVAQGALARDYLTACLAEPATRQITFWGISDEHSWVPDKFLGWEGALPFDADGEPKPFFYGVTEALRQAPKR